MESCPYHPNAHIIDDNRTYERICTECGLIVGKNVYTQPEWRTYTGGREKTDQSRVGGPLHPLMSGSDLGTTIDLMGGSGSCPNLGQAFQRHTKTMQGSDRDLAHGFSFIESMADRLSINKNIQSQAQNIYKEIFQKDILTNQKKSPNAMAAASLYAACRHMGKPVMYSLLCKEARIRKLQVGKFYKLICKHLDVKMEVVTAENYVEAICEKLALPTYISEAANVVAKLAMDYDLVLGRSPLAIAGAAIYLATQVSDKEHKRSRKTISTKAGVAEATLSVAYKAMTFKASLLLPPDFPISSPIEELPLN